ncbi:hypothetical protein [Mycobacterium kubicae]|uniref:hypothetical protein n=1 Tax=Mycobacterium kubicae TaxID=120959 RepID=UPI000E3105C0|nr:hypothetical protein [Mycobacterium kubicae]
MKSPVVGESSQVRCLVTFLTAAWLALGLVVIGAHDGMHSILLTSELGASNSPHALMIPPRVESVLDFDHPDFDDGSSADHHEPMMAIVLPRSTAVLVAGGMATTSVALAGSLASDAMLGGRGPHGSAAVCAGQDVLMRFCLSRR